MQLTKSFLTLLIAGLFTFGSAATHAETDTEAQANFLKMRAKSAQTEDEHAGHANHADPAQAFHGIFYGFVPCNDCPGIKMTLSLKQNNNYLLVIQYARESSREIYEKGKYTWNDEQKKVVLTPRKAGESRQFLINEEENLVLLNEDGSRMTGSDAARYELHRSDTVKSREIHFH